MVMLLQHWACYHGHRTHSMGPSFLPHMYPHIFLTYYCLSAGCHPCALTLALRCVPPMRSMYSVGFDHMILLIRCAGCRPCKLTLLIAGCCPCILNWVLGAAYVHHVQSGLDHSTHLIGCWLPSMYTICSVRDNMRDSGSGTERYMKGSNLARVAPHWGQSRVLLYKPCT